MSESIESIISAVRAAVDERNAKRAALGGRIREIAESVLDACALAAPHSPRATGGATAPPACHLAELRLPCELAS